MSPQGQLPGTSARRTGCQQPARRAASCGIRPASVETDEETSETDERTGPQGRRARHPPGGRQRLTDLAYALTVGAPLKMADGEAIGQVPDELVMKRNSTAEGTRVAPQLELSWSSRDGSGGRRPRRA